MLNYKFFLYITITISHHNIMFYFFSISTQAESFFPLRSLHGLEIAGNPWNCSCTLQPWREWLIKNNVPFGVPPICFYPKRLEGKSWNQLQLEDFACIPKITSSTDQERISRVVEGENGTLLCRLHTTPDTQVSLLLLPYFSTITNVMRKKTVVEFRQT